MDNFASLVPPPTEVLMIFLLIPMKTQIMSVRANNPRNHINVVCDDSGNPLNTSIGFPINSGSDLIAAAAGFRKTAVVASINNASRIIALIILFDFTCILSP